jgi:hypothetical protein
MLDVKGSFLRYLRFRGVGLPFFGPNAAGDSSGPPTLFVVGMLLFRHEVRPDLAGQGPVQGHRDYLRKSIFEDSLHRLGKPIDVFSKGFVLQAVIGHAARCFAASCN